MADMSWRGAKLISQHKIRSKRNKICEQKSWVTGGVIPVRFLSKERRKVEQIQQKYGEAKETSDRHYDRTIFNLYYRNTTCVWWTMCMT